MSHSEAGPSGDLEISPVKPRSRQRYGHARPADVGRSPALPTRWRQTRSGAPGVPQNRQADRACGRVELHRTPAFASDGARVIASPLPRRRWYHTLNSLPVWCASSRRNVVAMSIGILELVTARILQRQRHVAVEWFLGLAGVASVGFVLAFFAFVFRWIKLGPGSPAQTLAPAEGLCEILVFDHAERFSQN